MADEASIGEGCTMNEISDVGHSLARPPRRGTRIAGAAAMVTLVVTSPFAAWWVVGANPGSEIAGDPTLPKDPSYYDYMLTPPSIDPAVERIVGVAALVAGLVAAAVFVAAVRSRRIDRRWLPPVLALVLAGIMVGTAGRVMTAAVIGANIGGGIMLLFGTPVFLVLVAGSIVRSAQILMTTPASGPRAGLDR